MCSGGDLLIRGFLTAVPQSPAAARPVEASVLGVSAHGDKKQSSRISDKKRPASAPCRRYSWQSDLRSSYNSSTAFTSSAAAACTGHASPSESQLHGSRSHGASAMSPTRMSAADSCPEDLQKALSEHRALRHLIEESCQASFQKAHEEDEQEDFDTEQPRQHIRRKGKGEAGAATATSTRRDAPLPTGSAVYDELMEKNEEHVRKLLDQMRCGATVEDLAQRMRFNRSSQVKRLRQLLRHLADSLEVSDMAERQVARNTWELNSHAAALQASKAQCKALYLENESLKGEHADLLRASREHCANASSDVGRAHKVEGRRRDVVRQIRVLKEAAALATAPATAEATPALRRAVQSLMRDNSRAHRVGRCAEQVHWRLKAEEKELRRALHRRRKSSSMVLLHSPMDVGSRDSIDVEAFECDDQKASHFRKQGTFEVIHPYCF